MKNAKMLQTFIEVYRGVTKKIIYMLQDVTFFVCKFLHVHGFGKVT